MEFQKHELTNKRNKIDHIRYVAIGDTFATGFNTKFGFPSWGKLKNGEITGLSYPSFLARQIKLHAKEGIESFDNFALVGSTLDFWNALISYNKKDLKNLLNILEINQLLDWNVKNPFKNFLSSYFNHWNYNNDDFKIVSEKIVNANLLTISLGLDELFFNIPLKLINNFKKEEDLAKKALIIEEINEYIKNTANVFQEKYINLIYSIKSVNPNLNIYIVSYPHMLIYLDEMFQNFFTLEKYSSELSIKAFINTINDVAKNVAQVCNVNYIDACDNDFIYKHKDLCSSNIFNVFHTEKGYKKIALDLYTKLSLNKDKIVFNIKNPEFAQSYILNPEYWINDLNYYTPLFKNNSNVELFFSVYGCNLNYNIFIDSDDEIKYNSITKPFYNIGYYIEALVKFGSKNIQEIVSKAIEHKFSQSDIQYQSIDLILKYLSNQTRAKEIFLTLFKNQKSEKILFILQNQLEKNIRNDNEKITAQIIKNEWKNILNTDQKLIYDVVKQFFNTSVIETTKFEIKEIINALVNDAMNTNILDFIFQFNNNKNFILIREYLSSLNSFKEAINFIVESIINNSTSYSELNSFDELWNYFIIKNKYNLIKHFDKIYIEITSEENIDKTIDFIIKTFKMFMRVSMTSDDEVELTKSVKNVLYILKYNTKHLNNMFVKFIDKIKSYSLYDLIVKKHAKQNVFKIRNWFSFYSFIVLSSKMNKHIIKIINIIKKNKI
ncbi:Uncharacterised protein [Metamycoplasma cloacale]|uniref:SGNH/GDSL hydrolase family protein n=1 Tax=Metamycoplasma cloacale TaxID=92401 RepID=A0A2Z4LM55_9BACT|nr:hypothetical protein [Metamycoplasma cloacale]AWX42790.1 SGNH/GDSL hydrolase family protein [Metamycoplasma cloacale]VEU79392.1 Uncharacterised protein [Metamycoplasma cloacale]